MTTPKPIARLIGCRMADLPTALKVSEPEELEQALEFCLDHELTERARIIRAEIERKGQS